MTLSPFQRLLGADFERLPAPVRELHSLGTSAVAAGRADIAAAPGPLASFLRWFAGLPQPGRDAPVTVAFRPDGRGRERWERRFGPRRYASTMMAGTGGADGLLVEHFGLFRLYFRLTPREDGLAWSLARWRFLSLPLPGWTAPSIECIESGDGARFVFDIDVGFPIIGHVMHYRGWLERSLPKPKASIQALERSLPDKVLSELRKPTLFTLPLLSVIAILAIRPALRLPAPASSAHRRRRDR